MCWNNGTWNTDLQIWFQKNFVKSKKVTFINKQIFDYVEDISISSNSTFEFSLLVYYLFFIMIKEDKTFSTL